MEPRFYFNIAVRTASPSDERPSGMGVVIVARIVHIFHGTMTRLNQRYALAFPQMRTGAYRHPGNTVRIFGESREALDTLADRLEANSFVNDYAVLARIRAVPAGLDAGFTEYRRYRTPGRTSRLDESRAARLKAGDELPYLQVCSDSTGHRFSLRIQPIEHAAAPSDKCEPDSYGLSVYERTFALPNIPV